MTQPASIEQFVKQASQLQGNHKTLYVNQSDYTSEETIVTDEDTAGGVNMQVIRVLASADSQAVYWEEPFYDSGELEQVNVELESLQSFTRNIISLPEMEETKTQFGIKSDSIQEEKDPS
ncbi:hypothetical protein [Sporosarcina sp. A2]|uniref:hypothetical protein n=1 Tax=Sporosarcina sp. A2 TaxID=3393449 RepID=UPI003D7AE683